MWITHHAGGLRARDASEQEIRTGDEIRRKDAACGK
jgi:hypothetical protein